MGWVTLLAPIILELLKIFFSKSPEEIKKKAAQDVLERVKAIREALSKAEETGGDTSDLEKEINRPR